MVHDYWLTGKDISVFLLSIVTANHGGAFSISGWQDQQVRLFIKKEGL
jgi:hypothetical protein